MSDLDRSKRTILACCRQRASAANKYLRSLYFSAPTAMRSIEVHEPLLKAGDILGEGKLEFMTFTDWTKGTHR